MQKKLLLLLCIGWTFSAFAHDGTVNISGMIQNQTCTVAQESIDQTVSLGDIDSRQLSNIGAVSSAVAFVIDLQNCSSVTKGVSFTFSGSVDGDNPDLLALSDEAGSASGLGIAIKDDDSTLIPLNKASKDYAIDPSQADNRLAFYAQYMATSTNVTAGTANGTATFSLTYQ